ncbi:hypothetical protein D3C73_1624540 [compost metagenome]
MGLGQAGEAHALLVQVVTVGYLPEQLAFARLKTLGGKNESFADGQEIGFGLERVRRGLGQAGKKNQEQ